MMTIEAIDQGDLVPGGAQGSGDGQQSERIGPHIVGSKVDYPGVDA